MILFNRFKSIAKQHLSRSDSLVLAVSGGPDSVCLLDLMARIKDKYDLRLIVAHFNHRLRGPESDSDEELVKRLAASYGLEFGSQSAKGKIKSENDARISRFKFLSQVVKNSQADWLTLAHQADDQVETFWLHLLRGAGAKGLAGMKRAENRKGYRLFRPLLGFTKKEILDYNQKQGLVFRQDQTNFESKFSRNRLRLELIPYLEKHFQANLTQITLRQTDYFKNLVSWLGLVAEEKGQKCLISRDRSQLVLDRGLLNKEHPFLQSEIILWSINQLTASRQDLYRAQIEEILSLKRGEKRFGRLNFIREAERLTIIRII